MMTCFLLPTLGGGSAGPRGHDSGGRLLCWLWSKPFRKNCPERHPITLTGEKKVIHLWVTFLSPLVYGLSRKIIFFFVIKKTKLKREREKYENKTQQFKKKKRKTSLKSFGDLHFFFSFSKSPSHYLVSKTDGKQR